MKLKIGTRKSVLALWQAELVQAQLQEIGTEAELVKIESFGDQVQDIPLHKLGDKGVFTKALDDALLSGNIDVGVHSLKDVPTILEPGLALAAVLKRANPHDVLVKPLSEKSTPSHRIVATGSIRRGAFWKNKYPDDEVVNLRGNVPTRIKKVDSNEWYGAVFAYAGLERINFDNRISEVLDWMIPAPSQGAIGLVVRSEDVNNEVYQQLQHAPTRTCVDIERAFLSELDAGCSSPVGAYAHIEDDMLYFSGAVLSVDGSNRVDITQEIKVKDASSSTGTHWAKEIKNLGASKLLV